MKDYIVFWLLWITISVNSLNSLRVDHSLSTYVNFEKYFGIEEELITLADLFLKHELRSHEGEDVHEILNMTSMIDSAKELHKDIGLSYRNYIRHPVNTFHLTKRLATEWRQIVNRLLESSACVKNLRVKLQNMEDNIPEKKDFIEIAYRLTFLHLYGGFSLDDMIKGNVNGYAPKQAFSLDDISDIGHAAYDKEDYFYSYKMLKYVYDKMKSNRINELDNGITIGNQASRLSSVCYKMGHTDKAKAVLSELLKIDPKNKLARRNLEYYITATKKSKTGEPERKRPKRKSQRNYQDMCRSQTQEMLSKSKRLHCLYFPYRKRDVPYQQSRVKAEVLQKTPLIVKFHDIVDNDTAKAIAFMAYKQMSESMIVGYKSSVQSVAVKDRTYWRWIPKLQTKILGLRMSKFPPKLTPFTVMAALYQWQLPCLICGGPVEYHCNTCGDLLCANCRKIHLKSGASKHHNVVPYADRTTPKTSGHCVEHPGYQHHAWCQRCNKAVCNECIFSSVHSGHTFKKLGEIVRNRRKELQAELEENEGILKKWKEFLEDVNNKEREHQDLIRRVEKSFSKRTSELFSLIKQIESMNKSNLYSYSKQSQESFEVHKQKAKDTIEKLEKNSAILDEKLRSEDANKLMRPSGIKTQQHEKHVSKIELPQYKFISGYLDQEALVEMYGKVERTVREPKTQMTSTIQPRTLDKTKITVKGLDLAVVKSRVVSRKYDRDGPKKGNQPVFYGLRRSESQ